MGEIGVIAAEVAQLASAEVAHMGGGNYRFSPDELQAVIKQWSDLGQTITANLKSLNYTQPTGGAPVIAPGNEVASDHVANAAEKSNAAYYSYLQSMQKYVDTYLAKLNTVYQNYLTTEHGNASMANRQL
jgi:hypothetical protein